MKTIFLFVDKPTFIGDLLDTSYLPYLASKYKVIVFTREVDQREAAARGYHQSPNITYMKWQIENNRLLGAMKFFRFSCIREFDYLITTQYIRNRRGEDGNSSLLRIASRPFAWLFTSKFFNFIENLLMRRSSKFSEYCRTYQPSLVITATPGLNNFEAEAVWLAKKAGLPTAAVDCAWDNLTTRVTRVRPTDYFFAWHEPMRQEAIKIHGLSPERVRVTGPLRFDYYFTKELQQPTREEFLQSCGLDPKLPAILYTTQKAHLFEDDFLRNLIRMRNEKQIPYASIFIRVHPLARPGRFQEFEKLKDVFVDRPTEVMSSADLRHLKYSLMYADLNINYSSTISLEAMAFDKPVINYFEPSLKSFELNHYKPLLEMKALKLVYDTKNELAKAIRDYLEDPSIDREARNTVLNIYFPFRDGLCYKRNVDFLEEIVKLRK